MVRVTVDVALDAVSVFATFIDELGLALRQRGFEFEARSDGMLVAGDRAVARITSWQPGERVHLEWLPAEWQPQEVTALELRFQPVEGGTRITLEHRGLDHMVGDCGDELAGWFAYEVAAPLLSSLSPVGVGDWLTDRGARRPSGATARGIYGDPLYHWPNFRALLEMLALTADDHLFEVGCGGGAFLREALRSGCRAAAVDHSPDMVRLTREANAEAVRAGKLVVEQADASALPFPDWTFTCAVMTGVLGFLPDPVATLTEIRRVLAPGGRVAVLGSDPELRGTPAAPEPMASRLRFYDDGELAELGRAAGFEDVVVESRNLVGFAREAGVPEEHLPLFETPTRFLTARRR